MTRSALLRAGVCSRFGHMDRPPTTCEHHVDTLAGRNLARAWVQAHERHCGERDGMQAAAGRAGARRVQGVPAGRGCARRAARPAPRAPPRWSPRPVPGRAPARRRRRCRCRPPARGRGLPRSAGQLMLGARQPEQPGCCGVHNTSAGEGVRTGGTAMLGAGLHMRRW